ncbi:M36 family metallopeptidase [Streptomyces sp. B21-083]|uniref:M36 family metallopeptidase n=1 Tax=Streptomyces sp. B21-083 TaxID=3039410 RepID=UPI002FF18266
MFPRHRYPPVTPAHHGRGVHREATGFLVRRNAILQADTVANGGRAHDRVWKVFAHRGTADGQGRRTGLTDSVSSRPEGGVPVTERRPPAIGADQAESINSSYRSCR